jgi:uncharacterized protein (TIRG00374 family)
MARRQTFLFLGALFGAAFLFLALRNADWPVLLATLGQAQAGYIGLGLVSMLAYYWLKALRWRFLIQPFARASAAQLLPSVVAGLAGNYLLPHAGEIARAILAGRLVNAPASALLGSIAIERIFDFVAILVVVLAVLVPLGSLSHDIAVACYFVAALSAVMLAAVALFLLRTEACLRGMGLLLAFTPERLARRVLSALRAAGAGLAAIATPRLFLPVLLLSAAQWLVIAATIAFSLLAVRAPLTLPGAVSTLLLNVIGLTLPAAPGHVGTIQLSFSVGLAPFGVPHDAALAASFVYNALMVLPTLVLGLPGLKRAGIELRSRLFRAEPASP